jgi:hypothetical protein
MRSTELVARRCALMMLSSHQVPAAMSAAATCSNGIGAGLPGKTAAHGGLIGPVEVF